MESSGYLDYLQAVDNSKPILVVCHECEQAFITLKSRFHRSVKSHKEAIERRYGVPCSGYRIESRELSVIGSLGS